MVAPLAHRWLVSGQWALAADEPPQVAAQVTTAPPAAAAGNAAAGVASPPEEGNGEGWPVESGQAEDNGQQQQQKEGGRGEGGVSGDEAEEEEEEEEDGEMGGLQLLRAYSNVSEADSTPGTPATEAAAAPADFGTRPKELHQQQQGLVVSSSGMSVMLPRPPAAGHVDGAAITASSIGAGSRAPLLAAATEAVAGSGPAVPPSDVRGIIDKLVVFVGRNGLQFEVRHVLMSAGVDWLVCSRVGGWWLCVSNAPA